MTSTVTLSATVLGPADFSDWSVDMAQLPNGELFVLNYVQNSNELTQNSAIEFLQPTATSISNVTGQASSGSLPSGIGSVPLPNLLSVGNNTLPDIVIGDGGLDQAPWTGGQVRILAPNANGQYVDKTALLPQVINYNHRLSTGTIDGQAAIAVAMIGGANLKGGIELVIANADGSFTNWTSHLPAAVQDTSAAISNSFDSTNHNYTYAAIADFTGNGGDIFLGSEAANVNPSVLLVNDGKGDFSEQVLNLPAPNFYLSSAAVDRNGTKAEAVVVYAMPTKFAGDSNQDLIVDYANTAAASYTGADATDPAYYLQFLRGDGHGGFTDVTALHLTNQPVIAASNGLPSWITQVQQVNINGFNDLILYGGASPVFLVNNGQDVYAPSTTLMPNLVAATWGTDAGVTGFYGYNSNSQWLFVPVGTAQLTAASATLSSQLASKLILYGADLAGHPASLAQTYDTTITIAGHEQIINGAVATLGVIVNGQQIGTASASPVLGFTYNGNQFTNDQSFTFTVKGIGAINSLQLTASIPNVGDTIFIKDVTVNGVDLAASNGNLDLWSGTGNSTDTVSAAAWNSVAAADNVGSAANPIVVNGGGGSCTAYVLGNHTQYSESGIGTSTVRLSESAGLNQNAVLNNVGNLVFQDGFVLNTQSGAWSAPAITESAAQLDSTIDATESLAGAGNVTSIALTDGGIPSLSLTAAQLINDSAVLKLIGGNYSLAITPAPGQSVTGLLGHATTVVLSGAAANYVVTPAGDGSSFTLSNGSATYHVSAVTALQFNDFTDFVTSQTPAAAGGVSSAQVADLYAGVFGRLPDAAGLAYYEQIAATTPSLPITTYAEWFLSSPEYTGNSAHNYAQSTVGDAQFVTDTYNNLLHRAPGTGDVAWYQANVINPLLKGLTPGTAAYASAELLAHAAVLADFSASAEFLGDVQVTAQHPSSSSHWLLLV